LPTPPQAGIQRFQLADIGVRLETGIPYRWYVAVVLDPDRRSKDIIAGGVIERIEPSNELRFKLAQAQPAATPGIYAEAGIWYEAIAALSAQIESNPTQTHLRRQRASLLEQVGLKDIAKEDLTAATGS
jgi:hypothetical protein